MALLDMQGCEYLITYTHTFTHGTPCINYWGC